MLTVIDMFSKFVWIVPLKRKTGQEVASTFSGILRERRTSKMWADKGPKFYNKGDQKLVELYSTENEEKSCVIERFNRTLKEKLFKIFSANNTRKYVDVLDLLVIQYNNTIHSLIKITPKEASRKEFGGKTLAPKFPIGDHVRITKKKNLFDKGYTQMWKEEVFKL